MCFFDFFYLKFHHILIRIRGDDGTLVFSAFLYTSFFMGCIFLMILSGLGLVFDNKFAITVIKGSFIYFLGILVLSAFILGIRYLFIKSLSNIQEAYERKSRTARKWIDYLSYLAMFLIPVFTFVLFRKLYLLY